MGIWPTKKSKSTPSLFGGENLTTVIQRNTIPKPIDESEFLNKQMTSQPPSPVYIKDDNILQGMFKELYPNGPWWTINTESCISGVSGISGKEGIPGKDGIPGMSGTNGTPSLTPYDYYLSGLTESRAVNRYSVSGHTTGTTISSIDGNYSSSGQPSATEETILEQKRLDFPYGKGVNGNKYIGDGICIIDDSKLKYGPPPPSKPRKIYN